MRVLGISVWIYSIWIFVVGVILFFHIIHKPYEGFQSLSGGSGGSGSGGSSRSGGGSRTSQVWVQTYSTGTAAQAGTGSRVPGWYPINKVTDRLMYQEKLPVGGSLYSTNGKYSFSFRSGGIVSINTSGVGEYSGQQLASFQSSSNAAYIFHQGDIHVINSDGTTGVSPFVLGTFWVAASSGSMGSIDKTTCYLQLQNDGDLVLKTIDGVTVYHTNTAVLPDPCDGITYGTYPISQVNCFTLQNLITEKRALLSSFTTQTSDIIATQNMLCMLQYQDSRLECTRYRETHTDPSFAPVASPVTKPLIKIGGSLNLGDTVIQLQAGTNNPTASTDLTQQISPGDMVYLGYGPNIQGPFIVYSINATSITITKKYVGATITNMPISFTPVISKSGNTKCSSGTHGYNSSLVNLSTGSTSIFTGINYSYYASYAKALGETDYGGATGFQGSCVPRQPPSSAVLYSYSIVSDYINSLCYGKSSCTLNINSLNDLIGVYNMIFTKNNVLAVNLFHTNTTATLAPSQNPVKMKVTGEDITVSLYPGEKSITINNSDPISGVSGHSTCNIMNDTVGEFTLTSSHGPFTSIDFVYYGSTVTGTCATTITPGYDTKASSNALMQRGLTDYVTAQCIGKTSCRIKWIPLSSVGIADPSPGNTKTFAVSLSTATNTLPDNLSLGDIVFIKSSTCQQYDSDNNDGTCTRVLCKIGEKDIGDGICQPYSCNYTLDSELGYVQDTNNNDGTCTTPIVYHDCKSGEIYNSANNTCNSATSALVSYGYGRSLKQNPYIYDITKRGILQQPYAKPLSLSGLSGLPPYSFTASLETNQIFNDAKLDNRYNFGFYGIFRYFELEPRTDFVFYATTDTTDVDGNVVHAIYKPTNIYAIQRYNLNKAYYDNILRINSTLVTSYRLAENVTTYAINSLNLANQFLNGPYDSIFRDTLTTINLENSQRATHITNLNSAITTYNNFTLPIGATSSQRSQKTTLLNNVVSAMDALAKSSYARFNAYSYIYARLKSIYSPLPTGLISYKYNKQYGPFVINTKPTPNTLIVKSFIAGTLDSNGLFLESDLYEFMRRVSSTAASNDGKQPTTTAKLTTGTTLLIPLTVEPFASATSTGAAASAAAAAAAADVAAAAAIYNAANPPTTGNPPTTSVTNTLGSTISNAEFIRSILADANIGASLNVVANGGIKNAKLYKLDYQDGSFNGSYTSLVAGDSCGSGLLTTQNSITFSLTGSATSPSVALNSINLMIGLKYQLVVSVKATSPCTMKLEYAPSNYYMMSTDVTTTAGNTVLVNLTSTFVMFVWNFTAISSTIKFRINKSSSSTNTIIEFNGLSIQGGLTAPLLPLACANGTTVTTIVNGTTTVCST
jgi:hypothetical protein